MTEPIGFIGLGSMGAGIARNLLNAGYPLVVYNRTPGKAQSFTQQGATLAQTPADVARRCIIVFTMLTNDAAVEAVALGEDGFAQTLPPDGIHISCSTISPALSRRLSEVHHHHGGHYLASPVFGKPDAAEAGKLWIALSGDLDQKSRVLPLLETFSQGVYDFGADDAGKANIVKLAGNFMLGAAIEAMAEAYTLAEKNGIPRQAMQDMFSQTLFDCPVYRNYGKLIASRQYEPVGAPPSLIRKDLRLLLDLSGETLVPMPLAQLVFNQLTAVTAKDLKNVDWTVFAEEVSEAAGMQAAQKQPVGV